MSEQSNLPPHTSVIGGMRHYRIMWLVIVGLAQVGAIVFGLSWFGGVGLDTATALLFLLGPIALAITLYVAGEPGGLDVKPRKPRKPRRPRPVSGYRFEDEFETSDMAREDPSLP